MHWIYNKCRFRTTVAGMLLSINVSKREVRDCAANWRFTFCRHKYQWVENNSVKIQEGQNIRVTTVAYKSEMSSLKNNSFLSHRSVPKLTWNTTSSVVTRGLKPIYF